MLESNSKEKEEKNKDLERIKQRKNKTHTAGQELAQG